MHRGSSGIHSKVRSKSINALIPDSLSQLRVNKPLIMQLNIVYQCVRNFKKLANSKEVIRSLSDDITANDITRWVLPNYKNIVAILSMGESIDNRKSLKQLASCFQLLISSYCCFKVADPSKYVVDNLLARIIRNDILTNKTKNSKIINQLYLKEGQSINKRELLKLHCKLIVLILNLQLGIAILPNGEHSESNAVHFFHMMSSICFYLESLIHVYIAQISSKEDTAFQKHLACNQHYLKRTQSLPQLHVNDLLLMLGKETERVQDRLDCLKMIIREFLKIFNDLQWSRLDSYVEQHEVHACAMKKRRLNIQSTLLVTGELELISAFRLINWPTWAISS